MSCEEQNCSTCIWWERMGPRLSNASRDPSSPSDCGTCQARAPVVVPGSGQFPVSMFPVTHESRFCGDWEGMGEGAPDPDDGERIIAFPLARPANKIAA